MSDRFVLRRAVDKCYLCGNRIAAGSVVVHAVRGYAHALCDSSGDAAVLAEFAADEPGEAAAPAPTPVAMAPTSPPAELDDREERIFAAVTERMRASYNQMVADAVQRRLYKVEQAAVAEAIALAVPKAVESSISSSGETVVSLVQERLRADFDRLDYLSQQCRDMVAQANAQRDLALAELRQIRDRINPVETQPGNPPEG